MSETTIFKNVARLEGVVNNKWARVDIANWVNEAHDSARTAQVQAWQRLTKCVEVEERIAS
jgi:hypothetical protein